MKNLTALLLLTLSISVFAQDKALEKVEKIAKEERRQLWIQGHDDVDTNIQTITDDMLTEYVEMGDEQPFEEALDQRMVDEMHECTNATDCELYLISLSSSYYSGYGVESIFVMINPETLMSLEYKHAVYFE